LETAVVELVFPTDEYDDSPEVELLVPVVEQDQIPAWDSVAIEGDSEFSMWALF